MREIHIKGGVDVNRENLERVMQILLILIFDDFAIMNPRYILFDCLIHMESM